MSQVCVRSVLLVEPVFPLHDHAQVLVVHDEAFHVQLLYEDGGKLLTIHEEAAIAINVYDNLQNDTRQLADCGRGDNRTGIVSITCYLATCMTQQKKLLTA